MRLDTWKADGNNQRRVVLKQPLNLCSILGQGLPHISCLVKRLDTTSWAFLDLHLPSSYPAGEALQGLD